MTTVTFNRLAEKELTEAHDYYEERQRGLGERLLVEVERLALLLTDHPRIGAPTSDDVRRVPVPGFPYSLLYRLQKGDEPRILAVAHKRRRPEYWIGRS